MVGNVEVRIMKISQKTIKTMSKILTAEEFRKKHLGLQYNQVNTLTPFAIDEMLESYHKAKVESVSDEELKNELTPSEINGAKWLKQKLL